LAEVLFPVAAGPSMATIIFYPLSMSQEIYGSI